MFSFFTKVAAKRVLTIYSYFAKFMTLGKTAARNAHEALQVLVKFINHRTSEMKINCSTFQKVDSFNPLAWNFNYPQAQAVALLSQVSQA